MKALVLAGGFAKRMWPITLEVAKPLLEVAGRPVLDYLMERLGEVEVDRVVLTVNRRFEGQFREWARSRGYDVELIVEEAMSEEEKLGAVAGIANALPAVEGDDCLILAGDNVFDFSLKGFIDRYSELGRPLIGLYDVGDLDKAKRYAVVEVDDDWRIRRMVEKPSEPWGSLIAVCIYALPPRELASVQDYLAQGGSRDAPGKFIEWLVNRTDVYGYLFKGAWFDIGDPSSYAEADRYFRGAINTL